MKKYFKKLLKKMKKINAVGAMLFFVFYPLYPVLTVPVVRAEDSVDTTAVVADVSVAEPVVEPSASSETPVATEASIVELSATPEVEVSPEPSVAPSGAPVSSVEPVVVTEVTTPAPTTELQNTEDGIWQVMPNGKAQTRSVVTMSETYTAPQNENVTVKFTQLPDNPGVLTINEIKLSAEEQAQLGAVSDTAYDITSTMPDGSFKYDLTLPKPDDVKDVIVKYAETKTDLMATAQDVTQKTEENTDAVTVSSLNHFTVFYVSADTNGSSGTGVYTVTTGPSIVETSNQQLHIGTLILNAPSGFEFNTAATTTATISRTIGTKDCFSFSSTTATPTSNTITFTVSTLDDNSTPNPKTECTVVFSGIEIRPTVESPLANGDITRSGTATGATYNKNTFTETAGVVSASISSVVASPISVIANNSATSTITVGLKDQFGNPIKTIAGEVTAKTVTLSQQSGPAGVVINGSPDTTNSTGVATFTVKAPLTAVGTAVFSATDTTDSVSITQTASVTFTDVTDPSKPPVPTTTTPTYNMKPAWNWAPGSTDNVGIDYYVFEWRKGSSGLWSTSGNISGDTTSFTHDVNLTTGTWHGRVKAFDAAGNFSTYSTEGTVLINADTTPPVIATPHVDVVAEATSSSGAVVSYENPTATDNADLSVTVTCIPASGSAFTMGDTTITCNATDIAGNSATPTTFKVTVQDTTAPSVPINGLANGLSSGGAIATNNFDFTWDASSDISTVTYEFQTSLNSAESSGILTTGLWNSGVLSTNSIHSSGASDGTWYWQVRAIDTLGHKSAWSNIWNVTIDKIAPTATVSYNVTTPTNGDVVATLNPSEPVTVTNNAGSTSYTFTANGSFIFDFTDIAGNIGSITATVENIDKAAPTASTPLT